MKKRAKDIEVGDYVEDHARVESVWIDRTFRKVKVVTVTNEVVVFSEYQEVEVV